MSSTDNDGVPPYIILFLLILLIFLIISEYKFDQVLDVMLHTVSPPRGEAASPPSPRCRYSIKAVTRASLQLHVNILQLHIGSKLIFKRGGGYLRAHFQVFAGSIFLELVGFGPVWGIHSLTHGRH
jgi:hypothetical protein